jgi:hypothetical protein
METNTQPAEQLDTEKSAVLNINNASIPFKTDPGMPDRVVSMRDLCKRYVNLGSTNAILNFGVSPFNMGVVLFPSSVLLSPAAGSNVVSEMATSYGFYSGGLRYLVQNHSHIGSGSYTTRMTAIYYPGVRCDQIFASPATLPMLALTSVANPVSLTEPDFIALVGFNAMQMAGYTNMDLSTFSFPAGWESGVNNPPSLQGAAVLSTTTNNYLTLELPYMESMDSVYCSGSCGTGTTFGSVSSGLVAIVVGSNNASANPVVTVSLSGALSDESRFFAFGSMAYRKWTYAKQDYGGTPIPLFQAFAIQNAQYTFPFARSKDDKSSTTTTVPRVVSVADALVSLVRGKREPRVLEAQMESMTQPLAPPVVSLNAGVVMTHSTGVKEVSPSESTLNLMPRSVGVADEHQSLIKLAERENFLSSNTWSTETFGTSIFTLQLPHNLFSYDYTTLVNALTSVLYYRGDFVFTIQLNGTKFHQGMLIVSYLPGNDFDTSPIPTFNVESSRIAATQTQHAFLDASRSSVVTMKIPYRCPFPYNSAGLDFTIGTLIIQPFTPLTFATGATTSLNVTTSVHMEDISFSIPVPNYSYALRGTAKRVSRVPARHIVPHGNTITTSYKFGNVVNSSVPANVTGDAIDLRANLEIPASAMMDKPSVGASVAVPIFTMPMANICSSVGMMYAERMALDPAGQHLIDLGQTRTDDDEMSVAFLTSRMTYQEHAVINISTASGANVWIQPIMPCFNLFSSAPASIANPFGYMRTALAFDSYIDISPLDMVVTKFLFWAGSLRFQFQFVTSGLHTGRFWVSLNYGPDPPSNLQEAMQQYGVMVDLSEEARDFIVEVPFKFFSPRCTNPLYSTNYPTTAVGAPDLSSYTGFIGLWVINPLVAPPGVPTLVDVNVLMAAGPDFEVGSPAPVYTTLTIK